MKQLKPPGHRPGLPGKVVFFHIVPLLARLVGRNPAYKAGLAGHVPVNEPFSRGISVQVSMIMISWRPLPLKRKEVRSIAPAVSPFISGSVKRYDVRPFRNDGHVAVLHLFHASFDRFRQGGNHPNACQCLFFLREIFAVNVIEVGLTPAPINS
jgi:hypothetical protein